MTPSRQRQRTLFEYANISPVKSSRKKQVHSAKAVPSGEDSDNDDLANIIFEQQPKGNTHEPQSEEDDLSVSKTSPSAKAKKRLVISSDEDSLEEFVLKKKRRIVRRKRPSPSPSRVDDNEDEEDILEDVDDELIIEERLRQRTGKSAYVKNLERLKRRRKHQQFHSESSEESGSDLEVESDADDVAPDDGHIPGARPTEMFDGDENDKDDGFIVKDDEGDGVIPELPPEFSMSTFQDLSNQFKVVCQLFVHLAVTKPRKRRLFIKDALQNTYFSVPLAVIRRKLSGIRDSLVASSVWKPDLKDAMGKYPDFRLIRLDFAIPHCDACHLGGRLSTLQGVLSGREYNRETYEPLDPAEGEAMITWDLGRYCAARLQVYHSFTHWEHILYHNLRVEVETLSSALEQSVPNRVFLPATNGPSAPENLEDADGTMEWLDGRGIINSEWHRLNEIMDRAHNLEARGKNVEEEIDVS